MRYRLTRSSRRMFSAVVFVDPRSDIGKNRISNLHQYIFGKIK